MASPEQNEKFLEEVVSVYHGVNLLTIKKTYRILSEMEPQIIESFVKKYSDFVIFLLNILDETRSANLLQLLTDSSLVYLAEEELRSLLIQVVGQKANAGEDFLEISLFMDCIDRPEQGDTVQPGENLTNMMKHITDFRENSQNNQFRYLERVDKQRQTDVLRLLIKRNLSVVIGLMFYGTQELLVQMMHNLAESGSELLRFVPDSIYQTVIRHDFSIYATPAVLNLLPPNIKALIQDVQAFQEREQASLNTLVALKSDQNITPAQARSKRLEVLAAILSRSSPEQLEIGLADLIQAGTVQLEEMELIQSLENA